MKREGFRCTWRATGRRRWTRCEREKPRLVLLDVMMPGKTGFEVCQANCAPTRACARTPWS
jgi:DNA-binding response OmpR family regulator